MTVNGLRKDFHGEHRFLFDNHKTLFYNFYVAAQGQAVKGVRR
jgi:hypothetical protein